MQWQYNRSRPLLNYIPDLDGLDGSTFAWRSKVSMRALELCQITTTRTLVDANTPRVHAFNLPRPHPIHKLQIQPLTCTGSKPHRVIRLYRISPKGNLVIPLPAFPFPSKQPRRKEEPTLLPEELNQQKKTFPSPFDSFCFLPKRGSSSFRNRYLEFQKQGSCFVNTAFLFLL